MVLSSQPGRAPKTRLKPLTRQIILYSLFLLPGAVDIVQGMTGGLGANPVSVCLHDFGRDAFRFLLLSLLVSPLKRFTQLDVMVYRRPLGLLAFTYAAVHVLFYVGAARHFDGAVLWRDFTLRPFLTFGFLAFLIFCVLAATSTRRAIKALGRQWAPLHRFVYLATLLACVHYSLAFKTWHVEPFIYAGMALVLLALRLVKKTQPRRP